MSLISPHPGVEITFRLKMVNVTPFQLAKDIDESPVLITRVLKRKTHLTAVLAIKIGKALSIKPETLMDMQGRHDISRVIERTKTDFITPYPRCS